MLDIRIETFLTVCEFMNYTKAAQKLNITQPAVSYHIHTLEQEYGMKLFDLQDKKWVLTPAGQAVRSVALTMKHHDSMLRMTLQRMAKNKEHMVIGATLTIGIYLLPDIIADFLRDNPSVQIRLIIADTQELLKKLDVKEINFAFVEGFVPQNEYETRVYSREPFIGVCAADYPLRCSFCYLEDLLEERLLLREQSSGSRRLLERCLQRRNLKMSDFHSQMEINNLDALKHLTERGCGITFLFERAVEEELQKGTLKKIPIRDFSIAHDFTFLWEKDSTFSKRCESFFKTALDCKNKKP
ncbi:MAG: LysR family transcriptional regulator [Clostridiales bacterium]|jgi:DNA-binding transcriptional LysR family regulator|nr:LysR family transcriptional regulator [Clostridiales bacterium]MCI2192416.1 LysR family transcriptional regulator [Oscillospiraceae bacterium]MCI1962513.1 LysR family transcriptional regulator [Clostridiales bacterium]MCI2022781.1 LysR family transcriptional regulator [Clostridiales bacterium]MCI2026904.1 LysR family transcriptional regulator [Clostridiales bacterium]